MATKSSYTAQEAGRRFEALPADIKNIIYSVDMHDAIIRIGERHHLHIDKLASLETEVAGVMLGFTEPQDFPTMLVERIGVGQAEAEAVAQDINTELFQKIRESMKKMASLNEAGEAQPDLQPPAVTAQPGKASAPLSQTPQAPSPSQPASTTSIPAQSATSVEIPPTYLPEEKRNVEPINPIDQTLRQQTVQTPQKVEVGKLPPTQASTPAPAQPVSPQEKKYTVDPYREPVEG